MNILEEFNLNEYQLSQLDKYFKLLVETNKKINLTAITDQREVYIKHFYDSLVLSKVTDFQNIKTLCDVGSGAGFPSLPIKIMYPHIEVTIIEPTLKRINFLKELVLELELTNVTLINGRAEEKIVDYRESFEVVTARAVAPLNILLELCIPYVKLDGKFLALKGSNYQEELDIAASSEKTLKIIKTIEHYKLPLSMGERCVLVYRKKTNTPKQFPRKYAMIKKQPL